MLYYYKIYGLILESEIEFPEACEVAEQKADVVVRIGTMPGFIKEKYMDDYNASIYKKVYKWFYFEKEGNFLIENGNTVTVEPDTTADIKHIRALILGPCLGTVLYQRDVISIHGSAVVWKDRVIIVCGASGAGKSTVSSELRSRGCLFMADDTIALTEENGNILAYPSYPQQKLCPEVAIRLGYKLEDLILLDEDCIKYAVRMGDNFCSEKKEVAAIVCLSKHEEDSLRITEVSGNAKLEYITTNLYFYKDCKVAGMNVNIFKKCLEIARKVPVIKVERPVNQDVASVIADEILYRIESYHSILV